MPLETYIKRSNPKNVKALSTTSCSEFLAMLDYHSASIEPSGYRGRDGWEVTEPAPGGHYMEEARRSIGWGRTIIDAVMDAVERNKWELPTKQKVQQ